MLGWFKRGADVQPAAMPEPQESAGGAALADSEPHVVTDHGAADHPSVSMSVCEHGVATTCPACIAIGAERKRIEAMPSPQWLDIDAHVTHLMEWLCETGETGYMLSSEVAQIYRANCAHYRIEPRCERDVLKALKQRIKKQRLVRCDERGRKRKRTYYFLSPQENG